MKKRVFAGLLGVATFLATGCADTCEKESNRVEARQKACGLAIPVDSGGGDTELECTDADADTWEKLADCIEKAGCDQVTDGSWITTCGI